MNCVYHTACYHIAAQLIYDTIYLSKKFFVIIVTCFVAVLTWNMINLWFIQKHVLKLRILQSLCTNVTIEVIEIIITNDITNKNDNQQTTPYQLCGRILSDPHQKFCIISTKCHSWYLYILWLINATWLTCLLVVDQKKHNTLGWQVPQYCQYKKASVS